MISSLIKYKSKTAGYDVLVPLSGGVDSSFALIELVEKFMLNPLAFHNDHGYEPETATDNVRKLCKELNVDLIILQQDYKFMKKLWKYVNQSKIPSLNGCYVCGNILYSNALELAEKYNISLIINGYSKGQVETVNDKNSGLSWMGDFIQEVNDKKDYKFIQTFLKKMSFQQRQKKYNSPKDIEMLSDSDKILVIPFFIFRFYKTQKEELKRICQRRFDWKETKNSYPARTTNCMMNWLNNYFDLKKMNYSNYHAEYSKLIRAHEITREQSLLDLNFNPPSGLLQDLAIEIGIDPSEIDDL